MKDVARPINKFIPFRSSDFSRSRGENPSEIFGRERTFSPHRSNQIRRAITHCSFPAGVKRRIGQLIVISHFCSSSSRLNQTEEEKEGEEERMEQTVSASAPLTDNGGVLPMDTDVKKKGRGRPPKSPNSAKAKTDGPKRARGRPPKSTSVSKKVNTSDGTQKKRGRPSKGSIKQVKRSLMSYSFPNSIRLEFDSKLNR